LQDEAEANRGRLRVSKEMLRNANRRKQEAAKGAARTESPETSAAPDHANAGGDTHHVPLLRANRWWSHRR